MNLYRTKRQEIDSKLSFLDMGAEHSGLPRGTISVKGPAASGMVGVLQTILVFFFFCYFITQQEHVKKGNLCSRLLYSLWEGCGWISALRLKKHTVAFVFNAYFWQFINIKLMLLARIAILKTKGINSACCQQQIPSKSLQWLHHWLQFFKLRIPVISFLKVIILAIVVVVILSYLQW